MRWKEFAADYLHFTRRDRIAILVIIAMIIILFFLPVIFSTRTASTKPADTTWISDIKRLEQKEENDEHPYKSSSTDNVSVYQYDRNDKPSGTGVELFYFDPNELQAADWKKLGLKEKTIQTILHYMGKGGRFRKPEDLQKIYGLPASDYERIAPFVRITAPEKTTIPKDQTASNKPAEYPGPTIYSPHYSVVDINIADTSAFIALPGIGSKLAVRIVNFRDKLGGFYSIDQVAETFGLPDSTFQRIKLYLKLENSSIKKININTATVDELKAHPYIKWNIANPIVAYRKEHGLFARIEDIKKVMVVTEDIYNKVKFYLIIN